MEQTSKLGIVVDTRTAEGQLKAFRQSLREVQKYGENMDKSLSKLGSKTQFAGIISSLKAAQSNLQAFSGTAKNGATALNEFNVVAKSLQTSTKGISNNLNSAQTSMTKFANGSKAISTNLQGANTGIVQTQTNLMKIIGSFNFASNASGKLSVSTKTLKADIAALNAALATGSGALGRFGQASNAAGAASNNARARNTELANSYRLVNTGLQSNAQYLQQANRAMAANSSAAVAAKLNQDKLAISSSKVATASSRAAEAAARAQIAVANLAAASSRADAELSGAAAAASRAAAANSNAAAAATRAESATSSLAAANSRAAAASSGAAAAAARAAGANSSAAAAASRAAAAVSGEAAARERALAAASRTAAAAANAAAAQNRAAAAAVRLASAEARAAAEADRLAGGLGRANGQARGFMGTLNSLQGLLMGGMFSIATLGIIKTADEMQGLNSQIKLVTKSEEEYLGIRQKVREIADKNFSDVKATTGLYASSARALANLGKSQADVLKFTDAVSLAMRAGGRSAQEQASAILQLGQAMGANVVQGDEFRSIAENAPILLELVAKRLGVLPGQLKAMAADGKITGEVMYDALTDYMELLEEMAKKMPLTMSQAFTVAKNRYRAYVDDMMNQTGGMSGKIASIIEGMSANFDTLAKVAIAGVTLAFTNMALSIGTASTAMAIFNTIASMNPLILIAGGFLAVSSAIFGVNDVLTISGIMLGDFFDGTKSMLDDAKTWWEQNTETIKKELGISSQTIEDANKKNEKSFWSFYKGTETGFSGLVQHIGTNVGSLTAIFGTFFELLGRWTDNMFTTFDNMGKAAYNAGNRVRILFGGDDQQQEYSGLKSLNPLDIYSATYKSNADFWSGKAKSWNQQAGITPTPLDKQWSNKTTRGLNFGNVLTPGANSVLKPKAGQLPDYLKPAFTPSTAPMDAEKLRQKIALDEINALEESEKLNKKLQKEREAAARKAAKEAKSLGAGLVSNTNLNGLPLKGGIGGQATAGGKIRGYTAEFAQAAYAGMASDIRYFSGFNDKFHAGTSSKHATGSAFDLVLKDPSQAKKAAAALHEYANQYGYSIKVLNEYANPSKNATGGHLHVTVVGRKKGAEGADIAYLKQVNNARASEAAKAERERIKQAEEAQREEERIRKTRIELMKEYDTEEVRLGIEHEERVAKIKSGQLNPTKEAELIKESERRMKQELDVYKKGLEDRVNEFAKYKQTERDILKQQYDDDVFGIKSDPVLSRPENKAQLNQALENARLLNEYRISLYEQSLEQEKSAMYAFQKTERQILIDEGAARLADAKLKHDELRDYRIDAVKKEEAHKLQIFDANQELKLLELKKGHMTEMAYIKARHDLERQLINLSNEPQEVKDLQINALKQPSIDALMGVVGEIQQESPLGKIQADYERRLAVIEEYEQTHTDMLENAKIARLAIEQSYMDAKRDLMLTQGEALFGSLAGISKAFVGEQSGIYRTLFGIQQSFAVASAGINMWKAIGDAMAQGATTAQKFAAAGTMAAEFGTIIGSITAMAPKGFKQGGYTGNMGASQVAGVVHGQEYVFDAQSTKRIGVDNLNAMRRGDAPKGGGDVNINVVVDAKGNAQVSGDNERMGRDMANGIKAVVMDTLRKEKRQGGMLYG